jgi:hypothetical protein
MKKCCRCEVEKPYNKFHKNKASKDGYKAACKKCRKIESKDNYNPEKAKEWRENNKEKRKEQYDKWYTKNRETRLKKRKQWREENKDKLKKYREENKHIQREFYKRHKDNPLFKLKSSVRCRIRIAIKKQRLNKNTSTSKMLGCTWKELKTHLENQFTEGMTWDNYGKWHVDHIKPLALAKTEEEMIKLNHYTNLQPLWAKDNLSKGSKYDETI